MEHKTQRNRALAPPLCGQSPGGPEQTTDKLQKRKKSMKKRILSLALALTLCLGLSDPALAAGSGI